MKNKFLMCFALGSGLGSEFYIAWLCAQNDHFFLFTYMMAAVVATGVASYLVATHD